MKRFFVLVIVLLLVLPAAFSQNRGKLTTKSKRAKAAFERAAIAWEKYQFELALIHLDDAIRADKKFIEAWMLRADVYAETQRYEQAIEAYSTAVNINPDFFPANFYNLANFSLRMGRYADALKYYQRYMNFPSIPAQHISICHSNMEKAEFGIWALANPVPFNPQNLGDSVNGAMDELINSITPDGSRMYFTLRRLKDQNTRNQRNVYEEDFYVCHLREDGTWGAPVKLPPPLNSAGNEGALCIAPDGSWAIFTACYRDDSFGSCDLYYTERRGERWTRPVNLGENINSQYWETHASIASDGRYVYFVSNRPGGEGGSDIYYTLRNEDGGFSPAQNLGPPINTAKDEQYPFIHPDNQTLYFSSSGHLGLGGMDFFKSLRSPSGAWAQPENLGYPINSYMDEIGLIISSAGNLAYISSEKPGGKGGFDIYSFELPEQHRSLARVSYMKGVVFDKETRRPLRARFELTDLETGITVIQSTSDPLTGDFLVCLPEGKNYGLNVRSDGYLFFSEHFEFSGLHSELQPFVMNVPLQKIAVGEAVVLKNIFFDTDKYDLKPESVAELRRLTDLLQKNPQLKIEIGGHTDNVGSDEHNIRLSENRAKAVVDFLTSKGITPDRLLHKGYGKNNPIDTNDTPEGRANNRRTEFKVLSV